MFVPITSCLDTQFQLFITLSPVQQYTMGVLSLTWNVSLGSNEHISLLNQLQHADAYIPHYSTNLQQFWKASSISGLSNAANAQTSRRSFLWIIVLLAMTTLLVVDNGFQCKFIKVRPDLYMDGLRVTLGLIFLGRVGLSSPSSRTCSAPPPTLTSKSNTR